MQQFSTMILKIFKKLNFKLILFLSIVMTVYYSCNNKTVKEIKVINDNNNVEIKNNDGKELILTVAVSSMLSPKETLIIYQDLFLYMSKKLGIRVEFVQRKSYHEINDLLIQNRVDLALICSGAYIESHVKDKIQILVVPVNSNKPFYNSYIIVNKQSKINKIEDLEQKTFAYTDPLSNSGTLYAKYVIKKLGKKPDSYFSKTIYSYGHDISMQLVSKGIIDGASIDALIFNYNKVFYPEKIKYLKIINISPDFGIPPLVVPTNLDGNLKRKLQDFFLNINKDSLGKIIIDKLLIDKFIIGYDSNYNSIREMHKEVSK